MPRAPRYPEPTKHRVKLVHIVLRKGDRHHPSTACGSWSHQGLPAAVFGDPLFTFDRCPDCVAWLASPAGAEAK
jgi:hypothetical protein